MSANRYVEDFGDRFDDYAEENYLDRYNDEYGDYDDEYGDYDDDPMTTDEFMNMVLDHYDRFGY